MKKLSLILCLLFFCTTSVFASDDTGNTPNQNVQNEQSYFTANIQKQPQENGGKQGIKNHFTFFTININANGKVINYALPDSKQ